MNNRKLLRQKADTLTDSEIAEVLEYVAIMESLGQQTIGPDQLLDEEMLRLVFEPGRGLQQYAKRTGRLNQTH